MRHRDQPLVEGPGPNRKDGRATHQGRVVTRMPYHKETAELRLPGDTRNGPHRVNDGVWYPKQPALFVATDAELCPVPVFGRLPRRFLTKVALPWLKCPRQNVLHVCSGALREKWTVDVRAEVKPKIVADAMALPFRDGAFPAVLLDPPYVPAWARQYGVKYPPTYPLLREAARVTRGGAGWQSCTSSYRFRRRARASSRCSASRWASATRCAHSPFTRKAADHG